MAAVDTRGKILAHRTRPLETSRIVCITESGRWLMWEVGCGLGYQTLENLYKYVHQRLRTCVPSQVGQARGRAS